MAKCKCGHKEKWHYFTGIGRNTGCMHRSENEYCDCMEFRPAKKEHEYDFNFTVSFPGYKKDAAETLAAGIMDLVATYVTTFHGEVGGGGFNENAE